MGNWSGYYACLNYGLAHTMNNRSVQADEGHAPSLRPRRRYHATARLMFGFALLVCASVGHCVAPTPTEFQAWPDYCKTRYVRVPDGDGSAYARLVSEEMIRKAKALLGNSWYHVHHACYSYIWIARAERYRGRDANQRDFALRQTLSEVNYAIARIPPSVPVYWKLMTIQARVLYVQGNKEQSVATLKQVIKNKPDLPDGHVVLGNFLYKEGKFDQAREVLQSGLEKVPKPTAEMHYFLGMVLLKQGSYDSAREQAHNAYKQGYPLPGLRNRLKAAGHW